MIHPPQRHKHGLQHGLKLDCTNATTISQLQTMLTVTDGLLYYTRTMIIQDFIAFYNFY